MKVNVDQSRCCGAGQCALIAPEVFDQGDEDGIVNLLEPNPAADLHPAVREAAAVCPASAITIDDDTDDTDDIDTDTDTDDTTDDGH